MKKTPLVILIACLIACHHETDEKASHIIREWHGKEILFPSNIKCFAIDKNIECPTISVKPYKILVYTDSIGCMSCKFKLVEWNRILKEIDTLCKEQVDVIFYFQPKKHTSDIQKNLKQNLFTHPVFMDYDGQIDKLNKLPKKFEYQCFLLDRNNNVILIGNPSLNYRIWNLFKKT